MSFMYFGFGSVGLHLCISVLVPYPVYLDTVSGCFVTVSLFISYILILRTVYLDTVSGAFIFGPPGFVIRSRSY